MTRRKRRRGPGPPGDRTEPGRNDKAAGVRGVGVWLVTATAILLPLVFDPDSAVAFALPKAAVLGLLAYALGAALVVLVVMSGWRALALSRIHVVVALYLATLVISAAFAVDRELAVWGTYDRRLGLISALQLGVLYVAAATFVRTRRDTAIVLLGAASGGVLVLTYALLQRTGFDPVPWREGGTFASLGNANPMGHYFATLAAGAFAALLAIGTRNLADRRLLILVALSVGFVAGTVLSGARAPLLGLGVGVIATVAIAALRRQHARHSWVLAGLAVGVAAVAVGAVAFTPLGTRLTALATGTDLSVAERASIYGTVVQIVTDRPVLGAGPDNFPAVYNLYRPVESLQMAGALATQSSAHGWPWRVALDTGVVGLLAFGAMLVSLAGLALRQFRRVGDWRGPVLSAALVTFLSAGLFTVNHLSTEWMLWLAGGLLVGASASPSQDATRPLRGWQIVVAVALGVWLLWPALALVNDVGASRTFMESRSTKRDPAARLALARAAAKADGRWHTYWNSLGLRAIEAGDQATALTAFERAAAVGPYDPLIWKNLGTLQAQLGSSQPPLRERARHSAARASAADPRNPEARAGAAQIYLLLGDGDAAAREAELALSIAPGNPNYLELAANGYLLAGRAADARLAVLSAIAAGETWQRRYLLARAYVLEGRQAEARIELRRVVELDPQNGPARELLRQLGP